MTERERSYLAYGLAALVVLCSTALAALRILNADQIMLAYSLAFGAVGLMHMPSPRATGSTGIALLAGLSALLALSGCRAKEWEAVWPWCKGISSVEAQAGKPVRADLVEFATQAPGSITCPSGKVCLGASSTSGRVYHIDNGGTALNFGDARTFRVLSAAPGSGANGDIYFNSTTSKYQFYSGGSFGPLPKNSGGFGTDVSTGLTANHVAHVDGTGALVIAVLPSAAMTAVRAGYVSAHATGALTANVTRYLVVHAAGESTIRVVLFDAPEALKARTLACGVGTAPGGAETVAFTVEKSSDQGGSWSSTTLTCTITGGGKTCADGTNAPSIAQHDWLGIKAVMSIVASAQDAHCTFLLSL